MMNAAGGAAAAKGVRWWITAAIVWIRRPELGVLGQGIRYAIAGMTVACVSMTGTIVLAEVVGLAYEAAFAIAYTTALVTHFSLQRYFVWSHHEAFALLLHLQLVRYLPIALANYGVVAIALAVLPGALGVASLPVYVIATLSVTVLSFLLLRTSVFHAQQSGGEAD
jgi:putative flippase GtrA